MGPTSRPYMRNIETLRPVRYCIGSGGLFVTLEVQLGEGNIYTELVFAKWRYENLKKTLETSVNSRQTGGMGVRLGGGQAYHSYYQ